MKPAPFEYFRPRTVAEALDLRAEHGEDVLVLAGGQSLIPTMNFRLAQPRALIDLGKLGDLARIDLAPSGALRIGAMVRQRVLERSPLVAEHATLLAEAVPHVAHPQIRNRGTVGGTMAQADPTGEIPAVMLALGARLKASSVRGERWIPVDEFFTGWFENALDPDELLTEIEVPPPPAGRVVAFEEIARRRGDHALVGLAVAADMDGQGSCQAVRIGLLSAGDRPLRAAGAEEVLANETPKPELVEAAVAALSEHDARPIGDGHASETYRRALLAVLARRALTRAFGLEPDGAPTGAA